MSAHQALQLSLHEEQSCGSRLALEGKRGRCGATAGARDEDFALVLRVEVDEVVTRHESGLHAHRSRQSGLLVAGKDAFNGTVLNIVTLQNGQLHRTTDTIVGTQRCPFSGQPLAVDIGLDGVGVKIDLVVHQFVADHIHVALQNDGLAVLHARGGCFADDDVARLVDLGVQSVALAP